MVKDVARCDFDLVVKALRFIITFDLVVKTRWFTIAFDLVVKSVALTTRSKHSGLQLCSTKMLNLI
jgi:hypothetical protein